VVEAAGSSPVTQTSRSVLAGFIYSAGTFRFSSRFSSGSRSP